MVIIELLKALLYGIIEGITEWLPISSTGHLIILQELIPFSFSDNAEFIAEFWAMFEVVIQLGAVFAVILLFWNKLWPFGRKKSTDEKKQTWQLWLRVVVGCIPAGFIGVVVDKLIEKATGKDINGWLDNATVVAAALIVYGIAFIVIERFNRNRKYKVTSVHDISYATAFEIGCFQALAFVPGTSRSGSTILGSMLIGISRPAAAEFTFFLAIPIMGGASLLKVMDFIVYLSESSVVVPSVAWITLAVGCLVSFLVSIASIRFLMNFVKKHSFSAFGWYRIALGLLVLVWFLVR